MHSDAAGRLSGFSAGMLSVVGQLRTDIRSGELTVSRGSVKTKVGALWYQVEVRGRIQGLNIVV